MDIHEFSLKQAVEEIISIQIDQASSKSIRILNSFDDFDDEEKMINTDMRRLQQVLLNLLSNAIKFTNRNGTICIDSSMIKNDKGESTHVQIKVKDNGVGMTRSELKNLFKLFGTMKNTMVSNTKGIGLGLCISRMIVEIFGGSVQVESEPNKGATFSFTFNIYEKQVQSEEIKRTLSSQNSMQRIEALKQT